MAKRGARVIIACRDENRREAAAKDIRQQSGSDLVEAIELDLASLKSVRKCAESLLEKEDKIDYLINNAGESRESTASAVHERAKISLFCTSFWRLIGLVL